MAFLVGFFPDWFMEGWFFFFGVGFFRLLATVCRCLSVTFGDIEASGGSRYEDDGDDAVIVDFDGEERALIHLLIRLTNLSIW